MNINYSSSSRISHLIHSNLLNYDVSPRSSFGQLNLRTTTPRRLGQLCLQTVTSQRRCISPHITADGVMIINVKSVLYELRHEIKTEVSRMEKSIGVVLGLAVIQVGDPFKLPFFPSRCKMPEMKEYLVNLAEDSSEDEVLKSISCFNDDPCVHGIVVQTPFKYKDEQKMLNAINIEKDVDGFHPQNIGQLAMQFLEPLNVPVEAKACMELFRKYNLEINGKRAVVIGKDNYRIRYRFCLPVALLLERQGATVTIIHSKTKNPEEITREADIIITSSRELHELRGSMIKPGAVVIDLGYGRHDNPREIYKVASALTFDDYYFELMIPDMYLSNVLASAKRFHNFI